MQPVEQLTFLPEDWTAESICGKVAEIFHVKPTEVALLELRGKLLHFIFPKELTTAGAIPLSSSAVAARTAQNKEAEIFNGFAQVSHFSVFELVKIGDSGLDDQVIQKLMSAPVVTGKGEVLGVIQISRKGPRPNIAGPDFTQADLQKLESVASFVAKFMGKSKASAQAAAQL
ncbi:MAG: GAF domain-containing protein [Acidobacteriaceae bacterium]|nr:GAF domain-containing protein [Acidobacteriaceae bacterium]